MKYVNISLRVVDAALTTSLALQVENVQQSEVHRQTVYDPSGILTDRHRHIVHSEADELPRLNTQMSDD